MLILDDAMMLRNTHRRLRHSTNAELPPGVRRIKRSLSGRSLSTSMHNLHAPNSRSSHSSGKTSQGHGILISALRRQASLTERDMSSISYKAHQSQLDNLASEFKTLHHSPAATATTGQLTDSAGTNTPQDQQQHQHHQRSASKNSNTGSTGPFRQKRLASLQVGNQVPSNARQEYSDGYTVKDQGAAVVGHIIPNSSTSPQDNTTGSPPSSHNRSSTPALMMNKIKYDWVMSPTLPEIPAESRFGCGPLDSVEESH